MVNVEYVNEIRPKLLGEFDMGEFSPRTPAIAQAFDWGRQLHQGQMRLSGEPYFETHCAWVASFVDRLVKNEAWTIAALLHDTIEDTGESLDQIRDLFPGELGENIAHIVDGVTKMSNPRSGRSREIETLRKIARFRDPGVFLVKLADKSHNLLTLQHMSRAKQQSKAIEAIRAYGRLAGILNCYRWRRWIEDMAFPYADGDAFSFVKDKIDSDPRLHTYFLNDKLSELGNLMETEGIDGSVNIIVNGYWQSWEKLRRMARERRTSLDDFTSVNDLVSFRMVIKQHDVRACYDLLSRVNRLYSRYLDQDRFDDYIACPQNGYRALQVTAWLPDFGAIEIAISTEEMEGENLWGVVYAIQQGKDISRYRPIQILTPSGGTRFLPEGSSVLDAVTSIQDFLLDKISAVEVNNEVTSLSDPIHPGDLVEVITTGQRITPTDEWLNFSNHLTARALRSVLATVALKQAGEKGRKLIRPVLAKRGILALEDVAVLDETRFDMVMGLLACANLDDLYSAVGGGAIRVTELEDALEEVGISRDHLGWTTIHILGPQGNKTGVLAHVALMVSECGGNIIRSVSNTFNDGAFSLRLVIKDMTEDQKKQLSTRFEKCDIAMTSFDFV